MNPHRYHSVSSLVKDRTIILAVFFTSMIAACGLNMYSDSDEVQLGQQLDQEIRSNPKEYPILQGHPEVKTYVSSITQKILASPDVKKRSVYPYQTEIIHDDNTVNAFCIPGGYIYVYTGLLKYLDNEATLAGVIAHEIAHAERRHATKRITAAYGVQILVGAALGKNPSTIAQIAANLFTNLGFLKNSRDDEIEADNYSMIYLRSTEYYPGAIKFFFDKTGTSGRTNVSSLEKLFLTHPPSEERARNVEKRMQEWNVGAPSEPQVKTDAYQRFKRTLP
ncbi:MAG: M48 family metallopeptidase [Bacteroidota bacterium]|nr:M48 family metallopeptidase [Bacteroidota bacterium]